MFAKTKKMLLPAGLFLALGLAVFVSAQAQSEIDAVCNANCTSNPNTSCNGTSPSGNTITCNSMKPK